MRSFSPAWGNPEVGLAGAAAVQIGHYYHLPVNVYGLSCSVYSMDIQNGYERALNVIVPALAGADEISGVGEMAGGIFSCNAQMVVDNEILGMVQRLRDGFAVDEDTLALDLIDQVMEDRAEFSGSAHTIRHLRRGEVWHGKLGKIPASFDSWRASGGEMIVDHAQRRADELLETHEVPPLAEDVSSALNNMLARLSG
jgi:trimethylamine--corrinoid protein Co-methyltransferase